jgi:FKBP-type peptidyl-prolyl cis-trans isomerase
MKKLNILERKNGRYKMGKIAKSSDMVTVEYTGRLEDGKVFDTSEGKKPLQFMIGVGKFLELFEKGIIGMEEGSEKEIVIPSGQGYDKGELAGKKLIFKVKLLKIGF